MSGIQGKNSLDNLDDKIAFAVIFADPKRLGLNVDEIALKFGMCRASVYNQLKMPEIVSLIKEKRAERMKIDLPKIDDALALKAQSGDVKAIELLYSRWDDYVPRNRVDNANLNANSAEEEKARKEKIKKFMSEVIESKPESVPVPVPAVSEDKKA